MAYDVATATRNWLSDYISAVSETPSYSLLGLGVIKVDESLGTKVDKTPFINNTNETGTVTGYGRTFPFDAQLRTGETAIMQLWAISENDGVGDDAELYYVRVNLYVTPTAGAYPAKRYKVAVETTDKSGAGLDIMRITGTMHQVGDATIGTFNPSTKAFTAA